MKRGWGTSKRVSTCRPHATHSAAGLAGTARFLTITRLHCDIFGLTCSLRVSTKVSYLLLLLRFAPRESVFHRWISSFVAEMRSFALALPALVTAYVAYAPSEGAGVLQNGALQNILKNTDKTDKYRYPTDFTRGIEPVGP